MTNYKVTVSYRGTAYHGFQIQEDVLTVQGTIEDAIYKLIGERVTINGCSRTDAGVHANEFVANAQATRNPVLSPFFSLVDYAQRNNTVGSLTADDVSHALGTGAVVKATSTTANESVQNSGELLAVAGSISSNTKVVQRLNERLDEGIEAFMVMDGERGFDKKYSDYNRLKKNPKR